MIANPAKIAKIFPRRCSLAYMFVKSSSRNEYSKGWAGAICFHFCWMIEITSFTSLAWNRKEISPVLLARCNAKGLMLSRSDSKWKSFTTPMTVYTTRPSLSITLPGSILKVSIRFPIGSDSMLNDFAAASLMINPVESEGKALEKSRPTFISMPSVFT